jgi:hypothetical protein
MNDEINEFDLPISEGSPSKMMYRNYVIVYQPPPIPARNFDYQFCHDSYDGPGDNRCGFAGSLEDAKAKIDEIYYDEEDELQIDANDSTLGVNDY